MHTILHVHPCDCSGRGSLSRETDLSLESVKALGLLVGGMDNDDVVRPLEDLASLQTEIKESGYSKVCPRLIHVFLQS